MGESLGDRVAELRKVREMTQQELADRAEISTPFVSDIENDKRNVSSRVLLRVAEALDTSLDYLMTGKGDDPTETRSREIPPELESAAEEEGWSYSRTVALLDAKKTVLARRGGSREEKDTPDISEVGRAQWKKLYDSLFES